MSPRPTSTSTRRLASLATLGAATLALLAACADAPTAPRAAAPVAPDAPSFGRSSATTTTTTGTKAGATPVTGLLWEKPVTAATTSGVIGAEGGTLALAHGARLIVPRGAVAGPVTFRITRLPGRIVAYDFQPHGLRFAVPAQIEHPIAGVSLKGVTGSSVEGAYFEGAAALDQTTGTAQVTEFRPTLTAVEKGLVRFTVDHFSGYMVSTGRRR
ncbi:MAG: hypothetical protein ACXWZ4_07300 [Gemmatirosa sp.]